MKRRGQPPVRAGRQPRPGPRGFPGRGGGANLYLQNPPAWRSTSVQACGMWPFAVGAGAPLSGSPLGDHLAGAGTVSMDPINWFLDGYISSPSQVVIGLNGNGKSTLVRRQVLTLDGMGVLPLVLGDLKPDYVDLIRAIDGQIIEVGPGRGRINPLDPGDSSAVAARLEQAAAGQGRRAEELRRLRAQVLAEAHARAVAGTSGLITILRGGVAPEDYEQSVLDRAVLLLERAQAEDGGTPPELRDLLALVTAGHPELLHVAVAADAADYTRLTVRLRRSLTALVEGSSQLGDTFSGQTTTPMRRDKPVCVDIHTIDDAQADLQAAVLLTTWAHGFAMVNAAHALADAGLEPRRHWLVVMDEFWRVLQSGSGMVDRANALTRLDRQKGVGRIYIFHTMEDLEALPETDRLKARGFVARSGVLVCFGLPPSEMRLLRGVTHFSREEERQLTSWTTPPSWSPSATPPGLGKALIKVGKRPGIPLRVRLTSVEANLHNTNKLWQSVHAVGSAVDLTPADDVQLGVVR